MFLSNALRRMRPRALHRHRDPRRRHSPNRRARPLFLEAVEGRMLLSYSFALIADTGPQYSGLEVGQAINDRGAVAFEANLRSGGAGIFTRNPDGSQGPIIAITSDLIRTFTLSPFM